MYLKLLESLKGNHKNFHSWTSISPASISYVTSLGPFPSIVQPRETAVPKTSFTVPVKSMAILLGLSFFAISITSSILMLPLCLMFFTFFLSLGPSLRALMMRGAAVGKTVMKHYLFWTIISIWILIPLQSAVAF